MDCVEDFMFRTMRQSRFVKARAFSLNQCVTAWLFFEKSAELTVTLFFALRKSLCLSVESAKDVKKKANFFAFFSRRAKPLCEASVRQFLAKERLEGKQSVATDREAVTRAFLVSFFCGDTALKRRTGRNLSANSAIQRVTK